MFTFSKATSKTELRPSPRFRTFNGWTSTIERMRNVGSLSTKARKPILWLRRVDNTPTQSAERPKTTPKQSISPPLPLNYSPFPLVVASISPRRAEAVETTVPVYGVGSKDHHGFEPSCCAKVVLVASADASGPCRIRQIDTLPWPPILKPLPPLPVFPVPKTQPVDIASRISPASSSSSASPYHTTTPISLEDTFDDGLDDLSHFLRRIHNTPTIGFHGRRGQGVISQWDNAFCS
jgi:hypothetical protein